MGLDTDMAIFLAAEVMGVLAGLAFLFWLVRDRQRMHDTPKVSQDTTAPGGPVPAIFVFHGRDLQDMSDSSGFFDNRLDRSHGDDWDALVRQLSLRISAFPTSPESVPEGETTMFPDDAHDPGKLVILRDGDRVRLTLHGDPREGLGGAVLHRLHGALAELQVMRSSLANTPNPIFASDKEGNLLWANDAYLDLAKELGFDPGTQDQAPPRLFDPLAPEPKGFAMRRESLTEPGGDVRHWYDVCAVDAGPRRITFAVNVDTVVNAELSQRNFVQTLTKTFAHLSIGLAIFNRDRQLALFNPALVDLTDLPVDFLSGRPTIKCFFDMLREKQMMPEPKNYSSWRERIGTLVAAASDGNFQETWSLPSGQTYRVTGRPHPDGAVAFLFEDISHEVSLTRSFRTELALGNAVLDQMDAAMAVFTADGVLAFSNSEFRKIWAFDPDSSFADTTIADAMTVWRERSGGVAGWSQVEQALLEGTRLDGAMIALNDGSLRECRVRPLINGARMVSFGRAPEMAAAATA